MEPGAHGLPIGRRPAMIGRIALLSLVAVVEMAQLGPPSGFSGSQIRAIPYLADQVVPLRVAQGYAAIVEFAVDEAIDNVVIGSSGGWQVIPNRRGDRLVVKPLAGAAQTNMIVVTDVRRYVFLLGPADRQDDAQFVLRFVYPMLQPMQLAGAPVSATYRFGGVKALVPIAMNDDGRRTTISWNATTELPAIFAIDRIGHEAIVNGRMVGRDYVVEGIARRYVFRLGRQKGTARRRPVATPR